MPIVQNEANLTRAPGNRRGRPGPGGPNTQKMQNEPNLPIADSGQTCGRDAPGGLPSTPSGANVQNEPNLPAGAGRQGCGTRAKRAKRTQFRPSARAPADEMCKTKPIPGQAGWDGGLGSEGRLCKTNPISHRRAGKTIPKASSLEAATRAQRAIVQNEPNLSIADCGPRSQPGVTTSWISDSGQSCAGRPWRPAPNSAGANVQNEPNLPAGAGRQGCGTRAKRAKRTQFRPSRPSRAPIIPVFHHSSRLPNVQNEAHLPPERAGRAVAAANCAKRTQFLKKPQVSARQRREVWKETQMMNRKWKIINPISPKGI